MQRLLLVLAIVVSLLTVATPHAHAANDPRLVWKTIETPRFRISYYNGEERAARHVADLAEAIHARLAPVLGWVPREKVEIALFDQTDGANGVTSTLPYNAIRLFLTAPDDLSPLGEADDWYEELVTHEYTHTLHLDNIRGAPALVNAILGKTLAPNQVQPRWLLEGLAVYEESTRTSGGRLHSAQWEMYMRGDVLEDNIAPLDQFSNAPRRWPQGNLWYLYGSYFLEWLQQRYGEAAIRKIIDDYGRQLIPLAVNRSVRRATGKTWEELYPEWVAALHARFDAQAAAIRARPGGVREGVRVTHGGNTAQHPVWVPKGTWPDFEGGLVYLRDDGHDTPGLWAVKMRRDASGRFTGVDESSRELVIRTNGVSHPSFAPDGSVVFDSEDVFGNIFFFGDLHMLSRGAKDPSGSSAARTRLTRGFRAADPAVSPDGKRVVFTTNHRGTRYLQLADLSTGEKTLTNVRALVQSYEFEQAFAPTWAPDNVHVAYSAWTAGGHRDIRYVDTRTGAYVEIAHDRAIDGGPSFSADGRWIYFHSDRTGVMNVFAWNTETHALKQVTNVLNGAFQPEPSPDGRTLLYIGYTHVGYDVFAMPLGDPNSLPDAEPFVDARRPPNPPPPHHDWPERPYDALETLRPRKYSVQITPGNFGQAFILTADGGDIAGHHAFAASMTVEAEHPDLQFSAAYSYGRLPVDIGARVYRSIAPRGGYQLGSNYKPTWVQEALGAETSVGVQRPAAFEGHATSLSYGIARIGGSLPTPEEKLDPYETPGVPQRGMLANLHLGWSFSNAQRFLWSVAPEKGFSIGAGFDVTDPWLGSEYQGYAASADLTTYWTMPWKHHHVLGLHGGAGTGGGTLPGHGPFYVGGFVDVPLYDTLRSVLVQGGVVLRGYPVVVEAGRSFALFNAEYRFPIVNIDRGVSTLPFFVNRISGAAFVDYGSAFNDAFTAKFKTGVGGELWFDSTVAYVVGFTFRLGYARGLASGGVDKIYFVAVVPF